LDASDSEHQEEEE
jgi:hypothetical protein